VPAAEAVEDGEVDVDFEVEPAANELRLEETGLPLSDAVQHSPGARRQPVHHLTARVVEYVERELDTARVTVTKNGGDIHKIRTF
jgi:hypothetical protein